MAVGKTRSKFIRIKCSCGNEQNVFGAATSKVNCLVCGSGLTISTGGRMKLVEGKAKLVKVLD